MSMHAPSLHGLAHNRKLAVHTWVSNASPQTLFGTAAVVVLDMPVDARSGWLWLFRLVVVVLLVVAGLPSLAVPGLCSSLCATYDVLRVHMYM